MVNLFTSRWANRGLARLPIVPVGISWGTPKFPVPYPYRLARLLAPSRETFALRDDEAFEESYLAGLEEIGPEKIAAVLTKISDEVGGRPLALLCYEDVHAGQVCHRRMFAAWWEEQTGQVVKELGSGSSGSHMGQDAQPTLFEKEGE